MPAHTCTHIMVTGVRCASPALRGEQFCYFHQRMHRTVPGPNSRLHHIALLENEEAIQGSIMEVVNALIRGTIDVRRGELILRALNTAVRNSRRARFNVAGDRMVREVPTYEPEKLPDIAAVAASLAEKPVDPVQRKPQGSAPAAPDAKKKTAS